jgi:putative transposase
LELIEEAQKAGARLKRACEVLEIPVRTLLRWRRDRSKGDGRKLRQFVPANKLTASEEESVIETLTSREYCNKTPNHVVADLADRGIFLASEATMYRLLKRYRLLARRGRSKPPRRRHKPRSFVASTPNEVWTWDITYLPARVRGMHYYLYMIMDIFSRKIVGYQVWGEERAEHSSKLVKEAYRHEIGENAEKPLVLHSDNGSPMKGATMLKTLESLGIVPSFSRPAVSNDNPYSEALFKTVKYVPEYPEEPFQTLQEARAWVSRFVAWYNTEHKHSGIKYVTPEERHAGRDVEILENRCKVYQEARRKNSCRWSGRTRNWDPVAAVALNPGAEDAD